MRIVFVIKSLSANAGGAERVLRDVVDGLASRGHDIIVLSFDPPASEDFYSLAPGIRRVKLGLGNVTSTARPFETLSRIRALRRNIRKLAPEVTVGFMHSAFVPLALAMIGTGIPVVASEHIVFEHYHGVPLQRLLLRGVASRLAAITVISDAMKQGFPPALRRRMTVVSNPVTISASAMADVDGSGGRKRLLSVGRLAIQKNYATLISAFGSIATRFLDWDLVIVGEGEQRPHLEDRIRRLALGDRVSLPGLTRDVTAQYRRSHLFVVSSSYESFGLAAAEALAHGLPVVGFADCAWINTLISDGRNGLLAKGADHAAALAHTLTRVMESPRLRRRLAAAAPQSVSHFSVVAVIDRWEALLQSIIFDPRRQNLGEA